MSRGIRTSRSDSSLMGQDCTSTTVTGNEYDVPEGFTSQSRYTLFRPSDCPNNRDHLTSPRTDGVLSPPNPSSPTPCATSNARAPGRLNLALTTRLATKTHPRRLPNPPSKRISLPDTVRSDPNPLLQTKNPSLAKQKLAVYVVGIQGQFLFEPPTGPVLVQPIDRPPIFRSTQPNLMANWVSG